METLRTGLCITWLAGSLGEVCEGTNGHAPLPKFPSQVCIDLPYLATHLQPPSVELDQYDLGGEVLLCGGRAFGRSILAFNTLAEERKREAGSEVEFGPTSNACQAFHPGAT